MSNKDDRDNRSNQLNPNNSAYASSRSGSSSFDDDDTNSDLPFHSTRFYPTQRSTIRKFGKYGVGFVDRTGRARFFTFTLEAAGVNFFHGVENRLISDLERYFETFTNRLRSVIYRHLKEGPALFCLFDGTESCLPWHVRLELENPDGMRDSLVCINVQAQACNGSTQLIEALGAALSPPYEDWGTFEVESSGVSTLTFTYDARCRAAIEAVR